MPASGLVAPLRMLVAVRAMAPVAAKPPNSGAMMLAAPWPMSSWFESWRAPVMPSATTAVSSDSMAPNKAMAKAGPTSCSRSESGDRRPREAGQRARNAAERAADGGDARETATYACTPIAASMATSGAGTRFRTGTRANQRLPTMRMASVSAAISVVA